MKKNPLVAASLSIVPGLGHLYVGDKRKGSILLTVIGLVIVMIVGMSGFNTRVLKAPDSFSSKIVFFVVYLFTVVPCMIEAAQIAAKGAPPKDRLLESKKYVILLLLTTGMSAIPLLWDSPNFSKKAKHIWSIVVIVLGIIFIALPIFLGPKLDTMVQTLRNPQV